MAEEIVLNVAVDTGKAEAELGDLMQQLERLLAAQKNVQNARKAGNITAAEAAIANKELSEQIGFTTTKIRGLQKATETATKTNEDYGDSLTDERRKLLDMQKAYAALTKEERESAAGQEFQQKIKAQHDAVLALEKGIGQAQRNVGNYAEDMSKALGGVGGSIFGVVNNIKNIGIVFKSATSGAKGFSGALKIISTIGIVAIFSAIVAVVQKIIKVFSSSEERTNKLKKAFAPLTAVIDLITAGFSKLCDILLGAFINAIEGALKAVRWLASALDKLGSWLGFDWNLAGKFEAAAEQTNKLADLEEKYIKRKRAWVTEEAKLENDLAKLKDKVAQKDKYTASERLAFLKQANDIELKLAKERQELAEDHLAILEADAARADNDAEANDALAEAQAEVIRQQTAYYESTKKIQSAMASLREEIEKDKAAAIKAEKDFIDALDKERDAEIEAELKAEEERLKAEQAAAAEALKQAQETAKARKKALQDVGLLTAPDALEAELELLNAAYDSDLVNYDEYQQAKALITKKYNEKNRKEQEKALNLASQKYAEAAATYSSATAQGFTALGDAIENFAGKSAEANDLQQALAVGAVLAQEAQAIADGARAIAAAQAGAAEAAAATGPAAPATFAAYSAQMVGAVVGVVASVATSIAQAKKILGDAGSYATGGIVGGTSYTGDNLTAHVNSREMILTTGQQKRLFDIANTGAAGGFNYDAFAQSVAAAVANAPAPVLEYSEFKKFTNRVTTINEFSKI